MMAPRVLIAGVGNIFLGDDAFGVEVVRELAKQPLPDDVRVVDFGIRGLDLAYALLEGYPLVILVDAIPRGGTPGDVYAIEPHAPTDDPSAAPPAIEAHRIDPAHVLQLVAAMGGRVDRLLVVGCEPAPFDEYEDIQAGLSQAALGAVPRAIELILRLIDESRIAKEPSYETADDCR